ncbi:hypothetical protein R1sor_022012 [Riccia sorocarpa]|uniref:Endonuclease/exonuclease/phosphatase domain-containing protein n=1 Tax=Riccia sorocarpa TaxID=122646 RepID=A0ABD3GK59_9MARC
MSIYAPHNEQERANIWQWIKGMVGEDRWIITGDLNMVEKGEDTNCVSPLLKGDESLAWTELCQEVDLQDCYGLAARRVGSRFTRFQIKGTTVEMSRLDKTYLTGSGEWEWVIMTVTHDNRAGISDHSPVIVDLRLEESKSARVTRKSYTKISVADLSDNTVKQKAIAAWHNDPGTVTDPRIRREIKEEQRERAEVLTLVNKRVRAEDNDRLEMVPTEEDLDDCVAG